MYVKIRKLKPIIVLSPGSFIDKKSIDVAIKSFANLYHRLTPKHQRRLTLCIIEEEEDVPFLNRKLEEENIQAVSKIINRNDINNTELAYKSASVFLFPSKDSGYKIIQEALSFGLTILTFEHEDTKKELDSSCSILIRQSEEGREYETFSKKLEMLYFDQEVLEILKKGAQVKFEKLYNWGRGTMKLV